MIFQWQSVTWLAKVFMQFLEKRFMIDQKML